jgi:hypothetical protein
MFINLNTALQQYAEKVYQDYKDKLDDRSYRIANTLKFDVRVLNSNYQVILYLEDYWKYIENGRKAGGKFPPYTAIAKWVKDKGIKPYKKGISEKQLIYLIRRKISIDGIKPKHLLAKAVEENQGFLEKITASFKLDIMEGLSDEFIK